MTQGMLSEQSPSAVMTIKPQRSVGPSTPRAGRTSPTATSPLPRTVPSQARIIGKPIGGLAWEFCRRVLALIASRGPAGATDAEIAATLGLDLETVCIRRRRLVDAGLIVQSGQSRADPPAWIATGAHFSENAPPPSSAVSDGVAAPPGTFGPTAGRKTHELPTVPDQADRRDRAAGPHVPYARGSETSRQAADELRPIAGRLQDAVYRLSRARESTGDRPGSCRAARDPVGLGAGPAGRGAARPGIHYGLGPARPTRSGRDATVWTVGGRSYSVNETPRIFQRGSMFERTTRKGPVAFQALLRLHITRRMPSVQVGRLADGSIDQTSGRGPNPSHTLPDVRTKFYVVVE